jgi:hypothetical protein
LTVVLTIVLTVVLTIVLIVVTAVVTTAATTNSEPHTVILRTTLSDGHDNRLMVGSRRDGAGAVVTCRETGLECRSEKTIAIPGVVDTLEECESLSIRRVVGIISHVLDGNMGMADHFATLKCLWGSVVGVVRVGERSSLQVVDLHREVNLLVFGYSLLAVLGISENRRDHLADSWDISHDY